MRIPLELSIPLVAAAVTLGALHWHPWQGRRSTCCGSSAGAALMGDEATLQNAISFYSEEHGGALPHVNTLVAQLTQYTDVCGNTATVGDSDHTFGPYVRAIPCMPLGANHGLATIGDVPARGIAWIYDEHTGAIRGNCDRPLIR